MPILEKKKSCQTNDLNLDLKKLEREDQVKSKVNRRNQIIKIRVVINEIKTENNGEKSVKLKNDSLRRSIKSVSL